MFPARAGMSLIPPRNNIFDSDVPRASGDEPQEIKDMIKSEACSPRERG